MGAGAGAARNRGVRSAIDSDPESVALVTVMWANNEVGTVQPIAEIVAIARQLRLIPVHSDAVQAVGQLPIELCGKAVSSAVDDFRARGR